MTTNTNPVRMRTFRKADPGQKEPAIYAMERRHDGALLGFCHRRHETAEGYYGAWAWGPSPHSAKHWADSRAQCGRAALNALEMRQTVQALKPETV